MRTVLPPVQDREVMVGDGAELVLDEDELLEVLELVLTVFIFVFVLLGAGDLGVLDGLGFFASSSTKADARARTDVKMRRSWRRAMLLR